MTALKAQQQQQQAERRRADSADAGGSDSEPGEVQAAKKHKGSIWDCFEPPGAKPQRPGDSSAGDLRGDASPVIVPDQSRWGSVKNDAAATAFDELAAFRRQQMELEEEEAAAAPGRRDARPGPARSGSASDSPLHDIHSAPAPSLAALGIPGARLQGKGRGL